MKLILFIYIIFLSFSLLSCSSAQTSYLVNNEYMPFAIGNKWFYNVHHPNSNVSTEISFVVEIISVDTIECKEYFVIKQTNTSIYPKDYFYYQRISNDTLFSLNYDNHRQQYIERIEAIFSLDSNKTALIVLDVKPIDHLPLMNEYSITVVNKNSKLIEFYINYRHPHMKSTKIYKKGIGLIKTEGNEGLVTELIKYELKY